MQYYCLMVLTGEEKTFKSAATNVLREIDPDVQFYYFERKLFTEKRGWFLAPLFPGYLFLGTRELTTQVFSELKSVKGFVRILNSNEIPTQITGNALDELQFLMHNGEVLGVSKLVFLSNQKVKAISGPFVGYEGQIVFVNKKRKRITVRSLLTNGSTIFDLKYEEAVLSSVSEKSPI